MALRLSAGSAGWHLGAVDVATSAPVAAANPASVMPRAARAASTARLDGALTATTAREPGRPRLLHDLEAGPAAHVQAEVGGRQRPSSNSRPTTLSTALCRPMSSRTTSGSPSPVEGGRRVHRAGRVEQLLGRGARGRAAPASTSSGDGAPAGSGRDARRAASSMDVGAAQPARRRGGCEPRRRCRRPPPVSTLDDVERRSRPRCRSRSSGTAGPGAPASRPSVRQNPAASSKSWPGVRIVVVTGCRRGGSRGAPRRSARRAPAHRAGSPS